MPDDKSCVAGRTERLQKILSAYGVASRREAERMILAGRVAVGGETASLGQSAVAGVDDITVDGLPIATERRLVYIMLNKPRGYVTTMSDEQGRKTVTQLVSDVGERVYPVGRLDLNSEGLLLLTNDGDFANAVMHPRFAKVKSYNVRVRGNAAKAASSLALPVEIDSRTVKAASVKLLSSDSYGGVLTVSINEGLNRQVRKMCEMHGLHVLSLRRVSIGGLKLGSLPSGKWRHLTENEVRGLSVDSNG